MKSTLRRFAPLGLYLSGAAALAALSLYIIQRQWNLPLQISLGLVVIGLAIFALLDPERTRVALTGRQARYGSNSLVLTLAFLGILITVNYLVYQHSRQNPLRWDLTEDKEFTLSAETLATLSSLPKPVKVQAFFSSEMSSDQARKLLEQYKQHGKGKFDYEFIDPIQNQVAAEQAKITRDGEIVLTMGNLRRSVNYASEQELTSALVRLINPEERTVYFLTGHGEFSPEASAERSYSQVRVILENKNYKVKTLNLLAENKIPEDARVIVVAGPRKPVSEDESKLMTEWLTKGNGMLILEDPLPTTDFGEAADPLADYLLKVWTITLGKDFVVDYSSNRPNYAIGSSYGNHAITQRLSGLVSVFPAARSVTVGTPPPGITVVKLVSTSGQAWAETDLKGLVEGTNPTPDRDVELIGSVPLAVAGENTAAKARVVVFGDAEFASDDFAQLYANTDLFVNSVDWAAGQESTISLTPKRTTQRLVVPPQKYTLNLILFGSVFIIPGSVLVAGIAVWIQRRRRG